MSEHAGLRRRSPNPNSPAVDAAHSPDLLSPYVSATRNLGLGYAYTDPFERYHLPSPQPNQTPENDIPTPNPHDDPPPSAWERNRFPKGPTIRLIQPSLSSGSSITATRHPAYRRPSINDDTLRPMRSRSNDQDERSSRMLPETAELRRHGTDPISYPSLRRGEVITSVLYPRDRVKEKSELFNMDLSNFTRNKERALLPLPVEVQDRERGSTYAPPMTVGSSDVSGTTHRSKWSRFTGGRLAEPDTPTRERRGTSVISSLRYMRNPFRRRNVEIETERDYEGCEIHGRHSHCRCEDEHHHDRPSSPRPSSPRSIRSAKSLMSMFSSSTASSDRTLRDPYQTFDTKEKAVGMEKIISQASSASSKMTDKFPGVVVGQPGVAGEEGWTGFKWSLLLSIVVLFGYSLAGLTWASLIISRVEPFSDVTMVTNPDVVIFLTLASLLSLFTSLVGLTGLFLSSRPILAFYNLLLWPCLVSLCLVGYTSYKRGNLQLDKKLNQAWSQYLDDHERLRIQNALKCCGYYNPLHDATYSQKCYPRTTLPGCKSKWYRYEKQSLHDFATAAFSVVPFHLLNIVAALLCSNHVDKTFGKGLTPHQYRLKMQDVRDQALEVLSTLPRSISQSSFASSKSSIHKERRPYLTSLDSYDRLTTSPNRVRRGRRESYAVNEVMRGGGPRGRGLRDARERGII